MESSSIEAFSRDGEALAWGGLGTVNSATVQGVGLDDAGGPFQDSQSTHLSDVCT